MTEPFTARLQLFFRYFGSCTAISDTVPRSQGLGLSNQVPVPRRALWKPNRKDWNLGKRCQDYFQGHQDLCLRQTAALALQTVKQTATASAISRWGTAAVTMVAAASTAAAAYLSYKRDLRY